MQDASLAPMNADAAPPTEHRSNAAIELLDDGTYELVSGTAELLLEQVVGVTRAKLHRPGEFVLVPRNTWHT